MISFTTLSRVVSPFSSLRASKRLNRLYSSIKLMEWKHTWKPISMIWLARVLAYPHAKFTGIQVEVLVPTSALRQLPNFSGPHTPSRCAGQPGAEVEDVRNAQDCLRTCARSLWPPTFLPPLRSARVLEEMPSAGSPQPRQWRTVAMHCKVSRNPLSDYQQKQQRQPTVGLVWDFNSMANTSE